MFTCRYMPSLSFYKSYLGAQLEYEHLCIFSSGLQIRRLTLLPVERGQTSSTYMDDSALGKHITCYECEKVLTIGRVPDDWKGFDNKR